MKKILVLMLMTSVLFSCKKKDDGGNGGTVDPMVGNWLIDEIDVSGDVTFAGTPLAFTGSGTNITGGYNLKSDGTMTYDTQYDLEIVISGLGNQTIPMAQAGSGTWKKEGNDLVVTEQTGTQRYPIKVVTSNILILEQDSTITQAGAAINLSLEMTLRK